MSEYLEMFVLSILETIIMLFILHSICSGHRTSILEKIYYCVFVSFLVVLANIVFQNDGMSHIACTSLNFLCFYVYMSRVTSKGIGYRIKLFMVIMLTSLIVQLLGIGVIILFKGFIEYSFYYGVAAQIVSFTLLLVTKKLLPYSGLEYYLKENNVLSMVIWTVLFLVYYGISIIWYIDLETVNNGVLTMSLIVLVGVLINTIIVREGLQEKSNSEKLKIYDKYLPIIDTVVDEMRSKQHDYHNHLQTLMSMKDNADIDDASVKDYVKALKHSDLLSDLYQLENKVLFAFFHSKKVEAMEKGIQFECIIKCHMAESIYLDYELVEIYGILIDNAFEAVLRDGDEKHVWLEMTRLNKTYTVEVKNRSVYRGINEIQNFFKKGSTRNEGHNRGLGLYKLKKMLQSKKASIEIYYASSSRQIIAKVCHN